MQKKKGWVIIPSSSSKKDTLKKQSISDSLVINFDQTLSKFIPAASTTLAKCNTKQVFVKDSNDQRTITATFAVTLEGQFLGMQLVEKLIRVFQTLNFQKNFGLVLI